MSTSKHRSFLVASLLLCAAMSPSILRAEVKLPAVFGDGMVLQQGKDLNIWGWAGAGEQVTVQFGDQTVASKMDADGGWKVVLKARPANAKGQTLSVKGSNTINIEDVLIGEVWLCSGQSNMEWSMKASKFKSEEIP